MSNPVELNNVKLLSVNEVAELLSVSPNYIWEINKQPTFPKPIKLSKQVTRWRMSDIADYVNNLFEQGKAA